MSITKIVRVHAGELLELELAIGEARRAGAPDAARIVLDRGVASDLVSIKWHPSDEDRDDGLHS